MSMRWYIVHSSRTCEKQVAGSIREEAKSGGLTHLFDQEAGDSGVMVLIERVTEVRQGKRVDAERMTYPGYVFIRCEMTGELERFLRAIPHVTGILGRDNRPMPIADAEIDRMCATEMRAAGQ